MKQTDNYKLNQWDLSDRILMDDFNADNAKLEDALSMKLGLVEIMDKTVTVTNATSCSISFDGIQPKDCFAIFIEILDYPTTALFDLYAGKGTTALCSGTAFRKCMAFMAFPLRSPNMSIVLHPLARATDISPFTYDPYSAVTALTFKASGKDSRTGTFHMRVSAIL